MTTSFGLLKVAGVAAVAAVLAVALAQQTAPSARAVDTDADGDGFIDLAEQITGSDPDDPASSPEDVGLSFVLGLPWCVDEVDNDLDGLTDAADPGCVDSDGDFVSDPMEALLGSDPFDPGSFPEDSRLDDVGTFIGAPLFVCADGFDNDGDGPRDGDDPGCEPTDSDSDGFSDAVEKRFGSDPADDGSAPEHEAVNPGSCADRDDNDRDGLTDGADPGCRTATNDDIADATVITRVPFAESLKLVGATAEHGEPRPSCFFAPPAATVWYQLTPRRDGVLVADTIGSDVINVLAVWTDSTFGRVTKELACSTSFEGGTGAQVAFRATAGQTYFFQVASVDAGVPLSTGTFTFHLDVGAPPANDDFADAIAIAGLPFTSSVDVADATTERAEPAPDCTFGTSLSSTVWYTFTAANDALLVADTNGSDFFGAAIGVYQGDSLADLSEIACGVPSFTETQVAFQAAEGQTYIFQVGRLPFGEPPTEFPGAGGSSYKDGRLEAGGFGSFGNLVFNLDVGVPLANDNFADAAVISALPFADFTETLAATTEPGEPAPCGDKGATVWYRFTATGNGFLTADTLGSDYDTVLAVYTGDSFETLAGIGCSDDFFDLQSQVRFTAAAGVTYYFQVGGFGGSTGRLIFNLTGLGPPPSCAPEGNDGFEAGFADSNAIPCWTVGDDGTGSWCLQTGTEPPQGACSGSPEPVAAPPEGSQAAMTNQSGPGAHVLYRCLPLPPGASSATLRFQLYINNLAGEFASPDTLDFEGSNNQQFRADLVTADGIAGDPFTVAPDDVLLNIYQTMPGDDAESGYATVTAYIGAFAGQEVCLRFAEVDNLGNLHAGVDDVQVHIGAAGATGDVDCNGSVDAVDAVLLLQLVGGLLESLSCQENADVNADGGLDALDVALILQYDAELLPGLPPP